LRADFELQKEQYALSHPEDPNLTKFYEFYNNSMFGEDSQNSIADQLAKGVFTAAEIRNDPNKLSAAVASAVPLDTNTTVDKSGRNTRKFNSVPDINTAFSWNGKTYIRTGDVQTFKNRGSGYDWQQFTAIDLDTGETITVKSNGM